MSSERPWENKKRSLHPTGMVGDSRDVEERLVEAVKFMKLVVEDTKEALKILAELGDPRETMLLAIAKYSMYIHSNRCSASSHRS